MPTYFIILAIVAILLVGAMALIAYWFNRAKSLLSSLASIDSPRTPAEITLTPITAPLWSDPSYFAAADGELKKSGFADAGLFKVEELTGMKVAAYVHPREHIVAAVYDHPSQGRWIDGVLEYGDGTSLMVTNAPLAGKLDQVPGTQRLVIPRESGVPEVVATMRANRSDKPVRPIASHQVAGFFAASYDREIACRATRGVTMAEVEAVAGGKVPPEGLQESFERVQHENAQLLDEVVKVRYRRAKGLSKEQIEDLDLVVVHDKTSGQIVVDHFPSLADNHPDTIERLRREHPAPRDLFAALNRALPESDRYRLHGEINDPLPSALYELPAEPEEDDDDNGDGGSEE